MASPFPVPVLLEDERAVLNGHPFGLWEKEVNGQRHSKHAAGKQDEDPPLQTGTESVWMSIDGHRKISIKPCSLHIGQQARNGKHCCAGMTGVTLRLQSMDKYVWPMTKEKRRFINDATAPPAGRVSSGWISNGYSHPRGPHDHAYAESKSRMKAIMYQPSHVGAGVMRASEIAMIISATSIWKPACAQAL
jgi:hypothetical protein